MLKGVPKVFTIKGPFRTSVHYVNCGVFDVVASKMPEIKNPVRICNARCLDQATKYDEKRDRKIQKRAKNGYRMVIKILVQSTR